MRHLFLVYRVSFWDICFPFDEWAISTQNLSHSCLQGKKEQYCGIKVAFSCSMEEEHSSLLFAFHWTEKFDASVQPCIVASLCAQKRRNGSWWTSYLLVLCASIPLIFLFWEHSKLISTLGIFVLGLLWCKSIEHSTSKEWLEQMPHPRRVFIPMFLTKMVPWSWQMPSLQRRLPSHNLLHYPPLILSREFITRLFFIF